LEESDPWFQRLRCALLSLPVHDGFASSGGAGAMGISWPPKAWTASGKPSPQQLLARDVAGELAAAEALRAACLSELARLPTSAAGDEGLLLSSSAAAKAGGGGGRALGGRLEAAVRCRLEHKLLVGAALEALGRYEVHLQRSTQLAGGRR
jgi:hypothetical protein